MLYVRWDKNLSLEKFIENDRVNTYEICIDDR